MANLRQMVAEILLRAKTAAGAREAAADFEKVGKAADGLAGVQENNTKVTKSTERAYQRLQRSLDPLAGAQRRLRREEQTLERARAEGLITLDRYDRELAQVRRGYDKYKDKIEETERAQRRLERSNTSLGRTYNALTGRVAGLATAAAALGATTVLVRQFFSALERAETLSDTALRLEVDTEDLQAVREIADRNGASFEAMDNALREFNIKYGEFITLGTGEAANFLPELFDEAALSGLKAADTMDRFIEVGVRIGEIEDPAERAAAANKLLGGSGADLLNVFSALNRDGFEPLKANLLEAGAIVDDELIQKGAEANVVWRQTMRVLSTRVDGALLENADGLIILAEALGEAAASGIEFAASLGQWISRLPGELDFDDTDRLEKQVAQRQRLLEVQQQELADMEAAQERLARRRRNPGDNSLARQINQEAEEVAEAAERLAEAQDMLTKARARDREQDFEGLVEGAFAGLPETQGIVEQEISLIVLPDPEGDEKAAEAAKKAREAFERQWQQTDLSLDRQIDDVEAQLAALDRGGLEALDATRERQRIESIIAAEKVAAAKAGVELTEIEVELRREELQELSRKEGLLSRREADLRQVANENPILSDGVTDDFGDRMIRVAEDFTDVLLDGGDDFADRIGNSLIRAAEDIFRGAGGSGSFGDFLIRGITGDIDPFATNPNRDGRVVGQDGTRADPNLTLSQGLYAAGTAINVAQGFADGGTPGGLNALASALAAADPMLAAAIGAGRAGTAIANAIDGNGANPTTAAVGQFFGFVGGLAAGLFSKESSYAARGTVDATTGRIFDQTVKGDGPESQENQSTLRQFNQTYAGAIDALDDLFGGLDLMGFQLRTQNGDRNGFSVGTPGNNHTFSSYRSFGNDMEAALAYAVELTLARAQGGNEELLSLFRSALDQDYSVEDATALAERYDNFLELSRPDLLPAEEAARSLADQARDLVTEFEDLGQSTSDLMQAYRDGAELLAADVNDGAERGLLGFTNSRAAQVLDILEAQADGRRSAAAAMSVGGNVDTSLQDEFQRRQLLSVFGDLDARLAEASGDVEARFEQYVQAQAQELAALASAVDGVRIFQGDVDRLRAVQAAELNAYIQGLSDEDRLAFVEPYMDDLEDLGGSLEIALLRINEGVAEGIDAFEATLREREDRLRSAQGFRDEASRALLRFDGSYGVGLPETRLQDLRATAEELTARALAGDDAARSEVFNVIDEFTGLAETLGGSGVEFQDNRAFARGLLEQLQAGAVDSVTDAERALDVQEDQLDVLRDIRDGVGRGDLSTEEINGLIDRLPADSELRQDLEDYRDARALQGSQDGAVDELLARLASQFGASIVPEDFSEYFDDPRNSVDLSDPFANDNAGPLGTPFDPISVVPVDGLLGLDGSDTYQRYLATYQGGQPLAAASLQEQGSNLVAVSGQPAPVQNTASNSEALLRILIEATGMTAKEISNLTSVIAAREAEQRLRDTREYDVLTQIKNNGLAQAV